MTMRSVQAPSWTGATIAGTSPNTSSPTATELTPSPTCSTTPAKSRPRLTGYSCGSIPASIPAAMPPSSWLTDDACTRTSTSPAPGERVSSMS